MPFESQNSSQNHPLSKLPREDLDLITELVLRSGSLKDLATAYGVSYPTIRLRLDRVIERLQGVVAGRASDPLSELLASLVERGELSVASARSIRDLARQRAEGLSPGSPSAHVPPAQTSPPHVSQGTHASQATHTSPSAPAEGVAQPRSG